MSEKQTDERPHILRRATKIEWGLLVALGIQAAALIWGAAKLSAGVEQLNKNVEGMSDYSVLRYRLGVTEADLNKVETELAQMKLQLNVRR